MAGRSAVNYLDRRRKMKNLFNKTTLTKIVESNYPVETKVMEIMALYKTDRVNLLNRVANEIGQVIDEIKEKGGMNNV